MDYEPKPGIKLYIRDCYYRLIMEILFLDWSKLVVKDDKLVVSGNPGVGKSSLLFLFVRVLLELGVKVLFYIVIILVFLR
jgi:DNA replication protein DnaC